MVLQLRIEMPAFLRGMELEKLFEMNKILQQLNMGEGRGDSIYWKFLLNVFRFDFSPSTQAHHINRVWRGLVLYP